MSDYDHGRSHAATREGSDVSRKTPHELEVQDEKSNVDATWVHKVAFCVLGVADLYYWNSVLNILYDIRDKIYPDYPTMTDTLNAINVFSTLGVAIYTVRTGAMNLKMTVISGFLMSVSCVLFAIMVQWARGMTGVVLLHLVSIVAGACSGLYQTGGLALASVIGEGGLSGYVSTGQGITGVLTFILWQIISHSHIETKPSLWILMCIGFVLNVGSAWNYLNMTLRPEIAKRAEHVRKSLREEATNPDAPSYREILRRCWKPMFTVFWSFYVSLVVFPNIGPINWHEGDFTSYTLGCFQVGDLVGRYAPVLIPALSMGVNTSLVFTICRTIMVPLGFLCWKYPESAFWGSRSYHMVYMAILSITNGYTATCAWANTPITLPQKDWRSRAMNLAVICTLSGISAGLWTARIFTATVVK